jgi:hypothetical protein
MGIRFQCPNGHQLNVKAFQAGRTGRCPKCGAKVDIPPDPVAAGTNSFSGAPQSPTLQPTQPRAAVDAIAEVPTALWYVRPPSGGEFGPAAADIMREWLTEGRVPETAFVWREGWTDWRQAASVFPERFGLATSAQPATHAQNATHGFQPQIFQTVNQAPAGHGSLNAAPTPSWPTDAFPDLSGDASGQTVVRPFAKRKSAAEEQARKTMLIVTISLVITAIVLIVVFLLLLLRSKPGPPPAQTAQSSPRPVARQFLVTYSAVQSDELEAA